MTVRDLFTVLTGNNKIQFDEETRKKYNIEDKPLCRIDFWHKFRNTDLWEAKINNVSTYAVGYDILGAYVLVTICIR